MTADTRATDLGAILHAASVMVTCGPGGVGKTSCAAALGIAAAQRGRRVVVMTVDPARRLADALGIDMRARQYEPHLVEGIGADGGSFHALVLDAEATFDRLITANATDARAAERVLANPVYRSIAGSLAGAQDYMAIERLHQLHESDEFDLVVVDTPPSRDAIDLLEAPDRLVRFLGHPIYRAVTMPSRSFARVTNAGTTAFLWIVRRLAGSGIVEDTVEFFRSLAGMEQRLRERAAEVAALLRSDATAFVMVSSPRAEAVEETTHLVRAAVGRGFGVDAMIVNLVHELPPPLSAALANIGDGPLADLVAHHAELSALATSERTQMTGLLALAGDAPTVEVPLLGSDIHDVDGISRLAALLVR